MALTAVLALGGAGCAAEVERPPSEDGTTVEPTDEATDEETDEDNGGNSGSGGNSGPG